MKKFEKIQIITLLSGSMLIMSFCLRLLMNPSSISNWIAACIGLFGVVGFFAGIHLLINQKLPESIERAIMPVASYLEISLTQIYLLIVSILFAVLATASSGFEKLMIDPVVAPIAWISGMVCAIIGGWRSIEKGFKFERQDVYWAIGFFIISLLLRSFNTTQIPNTLTGDEGSAGLSAMQFIQGEKNNLFITGWFSFPSFYFFIQSLWIRMFGQTISALRLLSATVGSLTVGCTYLVGRAMFARRVAVFAGIFLVCHHFAIHFSRLGLNNIWDSLFFTTALGSLWYGWKNDKRWPYFIAGLSIAFAQFFYVSVRLLFALIPIWIVIMGLQDHDRFKRALPNLFIMACFSTTIILPLAWFFTHSPNQFMAPLNRVTILDGWVQNQASLNDRTSLSVLIDQISISFRAYFDIPLRWFYEPGTPILRPISAVLFVIGIIIMIFRFSRDGLTSLFLLWIFSITLAVSFSDITPASQRFVAISPAISLIIGYSTVSITSFLMNIWPKYRKIFSTASLALILIISLDDGRFYFFDYTINQRHADINTLVAHRLAEYLQVQTRQTHVFFFGLPRMGFYTHPSIQYLAPETQGEDFIELWDRKNPLIVPSYSEEVLFVFLPEYSDFVPVALNEFPDGSLTVEYDQSGDLLYWMYTITRNNYGG